jgi:hypothetical protein
MPQEDSNFNPVLGELSEGRNFAVRGRRVFRPSEPKYPDVLNAIKRANMLAGFIFPVGPTRLTSESASD